MCALSFCKTKLQSSFLEGYLVYFLFLYLSNPYLVLLIKAKNEGCQNLKALGQPWMS